MRKESLRCLLVYRRWRWRHEELSADEFVSLVFGNLCVVFVGESLSGNHVEKFSICKAISKRGSDSAKRRECYRDERLDMELDKALDSECAMSFTQAID